MTILAGYLNVGTKLPIDFKTYFFWFTTEHYFEFMRHEIVRWLEFFFMGLNMFLHSCLM